MAAQEPFPGAEQLQAAALGMIAASRAVLDAVEALVRDPNTATQITESMGHVARTIVETVGQYVPVVKSAANGDGNGNSTGAPFEHIEVS